MLGIRQNPRSCPSFTSKICFVSKDDFLKRTSAGKNCVGRPWTVEQTYIGDDEAYSCNCGPCQLGGLNGPKKMMFFHINPCMSDFLPKEDLFVKKTQEIEGEKGKVGGLVSGGMLSKYQDFSIRMLKKIYPILRKKTGDNLSVLWGQCQNRSTNASYNLKEDTWYIYCEHTGFDNDAIHCADDINKTYSFIHISDNDEVYLNGKKVDESELNQCSYEDIEQKLNSL